MDGFKQHKKDQRERRDKRLFPRMDELLSLRDEGFKIEVKTLYHYRVNNRLDIWPIHNRYHDTKNNKRGGFGDVRSFVRRFFK